MKRFLLSMVVVSLFVLGSGLLTWPTGLSYDQFTWAAYAGPGVMYPETEDEDPGGCSDGIDNDNDTLIDCADREDCADEIVCNAPAPVVSPTGVIALIAGLMLIGLYSLLRRRAEQN
jgi:hypothetical protein